MIFQDLSEESPCPHGHFFPGVYAPSHRIADKCSLGRAQSIRQHLLAQGVAATQQHPAASSTQR